MGRSHIWLFHSQYFKGFFLDRCCLDPAVQQDPASAAKFEWHALASAKPLRSAEILGGGQQGAHPTSLIGITSCVGRQSFPVLGGTANSESWTCQESPCLAIMVANVLFPEATRPYGVGWGRLIRVMFETTESRES